MIESLLKSIPYKSDEFLSKYIDFINTTKTKDIPEFYESHHILPRKLFPEYVKGHDWNMIKLSISDHIYAHWLLMNVYGENMIYAFRIMANRAKSKISQKDLLELLPKLEEAKIEARIQHSKDMKDRLSTGKQKKAALGTLTINNGTIEKRIMKGDPIPDGWDLGQTKATKEKKRKSHIGLKHSEAHSKAISDGITGHKHTKEQVEANRLRNLGKSASEESKEKCSTTMKKKLWITNGIICTRINDWESLPEGFVFGRKLK